MQAGIFISEASIISNIGANMNATNIILYNQADTFTITHTRNNLTNANVKISDMRVLVYFQP